MMARCPTLSGLILVAVKKSWWDALESMWESVCIAAIEAWQPSTVDDVVRRKEYLSQLRSENRDQRDADLIHHDGGNAEAAGTGGHD